MDLQPNKTDGIHLPITNTRISASEWNQLVGSCMAFITEAGLTPDASDNEQFLNAFKAIAAGLEIVGANTNLSNLTATGEARFTTKANTDLGNVTNTGKSTAAEWAMPSGTYVNLTLGASGSTYTAPANGYFFLSKRASASGQYCLVKNQTMGVHLELSSSTKSGDMTFLLPFLKGQICRISYNIDGELIAFRFYYAEGSKSEAN